MCILHQCCRTLYLFIVLFYYAKLFIYVNFIWCREDLEAFEILWCALIPFRSKLSQFYSEVFSLELRISSILYPTSLWCNESKFISYATSEIPSRAWNPIPCNQLIHKQIRHQQKPRCYKANGVGRFSTESFWIKFSSHAFTCNGWVFTFGNRFYCRSLRGFSCRWKGLISGGCRSWGWSPLCGLETSLIDLA